MMNTSVVDNSSMLADFSAVICLKEHYVGMIMSCIAMLLCFFLGTPAQSWFLWLYLHAGWKIKPTQVFLVHHTLLDLIYCINCALDMLNLLIFDSDYFWKETYIVFALCFVSRPLMQICICVEQYLAVLHPVIFLKHKGIQYRIASVLLVWLTAAVYAVYAGFADIFRDPFFYFVFLTAVAVISFCCVSVLRALKHPGPGDTQITVGRGRDVGNQQKRNAFKAIFSGLLILLFSFLPPSSLAIFTVINTVDQKSFTCNFVPFMFSPNSLGVMITPLLKMYREGYLKCLNHQRGSNVKR